MAETYAPIFPGNWSMPANAYALPNALFKANKRPRGDYRDRNQQAVLFMPGWQAVHKVAYTLIDGATADTALDLLVPSPHTRTGDKPLADIEGLVVPQGALLYRVGLQVPPISAQPGFFTQGPSGRVQTPPGPDGRIDEDGGLIGVNNHGIVLASAPPTVVGPGVISENAASTGSGPTNPLRFGADGRIRSGSAHVTTGFGADAPVAVANDMMFRIYSSDASGAAPGAAFAADMLGGVYLVAEVCYLVPAATAGLDVLPLPGARFAGFNG